MSSLRKTVKTKSKIKPTLGNFLFATPEQRLLRFLIGEPTTSFTPRVLSSKLKGVRGLGGAEGLVEVLHQLEELGLVQFIDNNRAVIVNNESLVVQLLKTESALCDLSGLREQLQPISTKGILFGSHADGETRTGSEYDLFVATKQSEEVRKVISGHPLSRKIELTLCDSDEVFQMETKNPKLANQLDNGITMWGSGW